MNIKNMGFLKNIESVLEALQTPEGVEIVKNIGEMTIDELLDTGIIKDIPMLSSLYSIVKLNSSLREIIFIKKLFLFYQEIGYVDNRFKDKFLSKYKSDTQYKKQVGEYIINALDRLDQIDKAEAAGKIFAAYMSDKINFNEWKQYFYALDKIDYSNITILKDFYLSKMSPDQSYFLQNFAFTGLVLIDFGEPLMNHSYFSEFTTQASFAKNEFGEKFLRILELI